MINLILKEELSSLLNNAHAYYSTEHGKHYLDKARKLLQGTDTTPKANWTINQIGTILIAINGCGKEMGEEPCLTIDKAYLVIDISYDEEEGNSIIIIDDNGDLHPFNFNKIKRFFKPI